MTGGTPPPTNPYVGPRPFMPGEKLHGREREVLRLVDLLIAERIVLLYSPSGAGKTSLIQAALLPQLEAEEFQVLPVMRVNLEPPTGIDANRYVLSALLSMDERLPRAQQTPLATLATLDLASYLERRPRQEDEPGNTVLIFDQFEEILTVDPTNQAAKAEFFAQLGAALDDRSRWALFSMREDYVAGLDPYLRLVPTRLSATFRLDLLGENAARAAVQEPARKAGVEFTAAAAAKLVDDLRRVRVQRPDGTSVEQLGPYIEPVQLQVVCYRLWEHRPVGATELGESDVSTVGDVDSALGDYYGERVAMIAAATGVAERAIRDWCEQQLITDQDVRGQVLMGKDRSGGLPNAAVKGLIDTHLVRAEPRRGVFWYELAHDRLIAPIRKSNAAWRDAHLSMLQRQAIAWERQGGSPGLLLRDSALAEAEQWAAAHPDELNPLDRELLAESLEARQTRRQQQQALRNRTLVRVFAAIGTIVLVALAITITFYLRAKQSEREARQAEQEARQAEQEATTERERALRAERVSRLTAASSSSFETQPQLGLLLAVEAARGAVTATTTLTPATQAPLADKEALIDATAPFSNTAGRELLRQGLRIIGGTSLGTFKRPVSMVAYSPGGRLVVAASGSSLRIWDRYEAARSPAPIESGPANVTAVAFSPDGRWLAAALDDGLARLWPLGDDGHLEDERPLRAHQGRINAIAFHPDGTWLATGGDDRMLRLWDLGKSGAAPEPEASLELGAGVSTVLFSADGGQLIAGTKAPASPGPNIYGPVVRIWRFTSEGPAGVRHTLDTRADVQTLAVSPDGHWLAAGFTDHNVTLWDLAVPDDEAPTPVSFTGGEWLPYPAFSPDGRWLVLPGAVTTLRNLMNDGLHRDPVELTAAAIIGQASTFSPDGRWLVTAGNDRVVRVWNLGKVTEPARVLRGHEGGIRAVAFNADGTHLVSADDAGEVREWEVPSFAADPEVLAGPSQSGGVHVWTVEPGRRPAARSLLAMEGTRYGVSVSHDGHWAATLDITSQNLRLWSLKNPQEVPIPLSPPATYWSMPVFDPQGRWLVGGGYDGKVRLWSLGERPGELLAEWQAHDGGPVRDLAVSADGRLLATAGHGDGLARVWSLGGALPPRQSVSIRAGGERSYTIRAVAISADGKRVITGSWENDYAARIWELADPAAAPIEIQFEGRVFDVAFSPDGRWAAAGSWDGTVSLVDLDSSERKPIRLSGFRARVLTLAFSPDSRWLAVGNEDRAVRLWDLTLSDLSVPQVVLEGPYGIGFVQFSPDGRWLLTEQGEYQSHHFDRSGHTLVTGYEQTRLYRLQTAELLDLACRVAARNLTSDEWQRLISSSDETPYRDICPASGTPAAGHEVVESLVRRAFILLGRGSLVEARPLLDQVRGLDSARITVPQDSLELQAALALAEHGDAPAALRAFSELDAGNPTPLTAENWNALCWQGSLNGYAREVLPACERALALDPGNGGIRDSRGLARALAGDTAGAIEDFEAFNRWAADSGYADLILVRERWIEDLRAGRDPFDDATLLALRE